jgi:hypothetical protein
MPTFLFNHERWDLWETYEDPDIDTGTDSDDEDED